MKNNLGHSSGMYRKFPYGIYSKEEIKLEGGKVKGNIASEKDIIIKEGFILDNNENDSIYLLKGNNINGPGSEIYNNQLGILDKLPIYELPIFPLIPKFLNKKYEEQIVSINEDIELKTNVSIEVETKIDKEDKEIEIILKMNKTIIGDLYIDIVHINSNYEELEIELKNDLNVTGDIYININSNAKKIEFEFGKNTKISGNIYIVNINETEFNDTDFELEFDDFSSVIGNIHIESSSKEIEVELEDNAKLMGNIYSNSIRKSFKTELKIELDRDANITGNIYSNAIEVEIEGDNQNISIIKGLIYAPHSEIELENGIKIYGAVVGNKVKVKDRDTEIIYSPESIVEEDSAITTQNN